MSEHVNVKLEPEYEAEFENVDASCRLLLNDNIDLSNVKLEEGVVPQVEQSNVHDNGCENILSSSQFNDHPVHIKTDSSYQNRTNEKRFYKIKLFTSAKRLTVHDNNSKINDSLDTPDDEGFVILNYITEEDLHSSEPSFSTLNTPTSSVETSLTSQHSRTKRIINGGGKLRRRRERNKESARKCRLKRRIHEIRLEEEAQGLEDQNFKLKAQIAELERIVHNFRTLHHNPPQCYLSINSETSSEGDGKYREKHEAACQSRVEQKQAQGLQVADLERIVRNLWTNVSDPPQCHSSNTSETSSEGGGKYREKREKRNEASRKYRLQRRIKQVKQEEEIRLLTDRYIESKAQVVVLERIVRNFRTNVGDPPQCHSSNISASSAEGVGKYQETREKQNEAAFKKKIQEEAQGLEVAKLEGTVHNFRTNHGRAPKYHSSNISASASDRKDRENRDKNNEASRKYRLRRRIKQVKREEAIRILTDRCNESKAQVAELERIVHKFRTNVSDPPQYHSSNISETSSEGGGKVWEKHNEAQGLEFAELNFNTNLRDPQQRQSSNISGSETNRNDRENRDKNNKAACKYRLKRRIKQVKREEAIRLLKDKYIESKAQVAELEKIVHNFRTNVSDHSSNISETSSEGGGKLWEKREKHNEPASCKSQFKKGIQKEEVSDPALSHSSNISETSSEAACKFLIKEEIQEEEEEEAQGLERTVHNFRTNRGRPPKRRSANTSAAESDRKYRENRDKNNESSRKSRLKKLNKQVKQEEEVQRLEDRNFKLKAQVAALESTVHNFRTKLSQILCKTENHV